MAKFKLRITKKSQTQLFQTLLERANELTEFAAKKGLTMAWIYDSLKDTHQALGLGKQYHISLCNGSAGSSFISLQYGTDGCANATISERQAIEPMKVISEVDLMEG